MLAMKKQAMPGAGATTHAGGVVVRYRKRVAEFLVVTAHPEGEEWVLPKGHIDPGETARDAAAREVREESGASASIVRSLGVWGLGVCGESVQVEFFLMRLLAEGPGGEGRRRKWLTEEEAMRALGFPESRAVVGRAAVALQSMPAPE